MAKKAAKAEEPETLADVPREKLLHDWVVQGMANYKEGLTRRLAEILRDDLSASELALIYAYLRQAQNAVEDATAPLDEAITKLGDEVLPEAFLKDHVTSINTSIGYRVTISYLFFATIIKDVKDAAYDWLRANQMGDLIQPTVNAGTLRAEARKMLEDGKELPEELFSTGTKPSTSLTKIKDK